MLTLGTLGTHQPFAKGNAHSILLRLYCGNMSIEEHHSLAPTLNSIHLHMNYRDRLNGVSRKTLFSSSHVIHTSHWSKTTETTEM